MDREVRKIPGVIWGFTQPIADDMEEAVSGVKGQLAIKIYGEDLKTLEDKGAEVVDAMRPIRGVVDVGMFRVIGQPNLNLAVDREAAARFQINVADVQDAIQTAVGGNTVGQVLQGEQRYDLVARYLPATAIPGKPSRRSASLHLPASASRWRSYAKSAWRTARPTLYREANSRYIGIKYSVRGRDLGSTVEEAMQA